MIVSQDKTNGYVYILGVKDIDLPVCKIGMTRRNPFDRCREINKSSTGDFIWEVANHVTVNDCKALESLVHMKLEPLRQRNREFFNINTDVAYTAMRSILDSQSEVIEISLEEGDVSDHEISTPTKSRRSQKIQFRKIDSEYAEILQSFTSLTNCKGRPFGQLNKPFFGMSDGNEGVQWNIAIFTETQKARLGVNLEGKKYRNWPIATFILSELQNPGFDGLRAKLENPNCIYVRFMRDAWQVTSRPSIVEQLIGGREIPISEIDPPLWYSMLGEALDCLNEAKEYRGRNEQVVTLANQPKKGPRSRSMEVSPHLTIWTPINLSGDVMAELVAGLKRLQPVHDWISKVTQ